MEDDNKKLRLRIEQLEDSMRLQNLFIPSKPDPDLAEDEWYAIFVDHRNLLTGTLTKIPWADGSNMTSTFKVKRIS